VIIFASQIRDLLGLSLTAPEPGPLLAKLGVLARSIGSVSPVAIALSALTIVIIVAVNRLRPRWPAMLIAVTAASLVAAFGQLAVETIGTRFGGIPSMLPQPSLPDWSAEKLTAILPSAVSFALLGSIESLLSAVVADGMTGRRHRSNCELVGQGVANIASGLFGGFCVTGTIARTATNVRAGAHGPIAGMLHAMFVLLFVLIAAPLASYIPLASLAGVLAVVSWKMIERHAIATLFRSSWGDAAVLLVTLFLTIFRDLTEAIVVGFALGSVLFIHRMSKATAVSHHQPFFADDKADDANGDRRPYDELLASNPDVVVYRISGAFFFGAAAAVGMALDRISEAYRTLIIDFSDVPFLDSTAAVTIQGFARKASGRGTRVVLTGVTPEIQRQLGAQGVKPPVAEFMSTVKRALEAVSIAAP